MAWIHVIPEEAAGPELVPLYGEIVDPVSGRVDNILGIHSLHPDGLAGHFSLYKAVMTGTPTLRKAEREMIALVVSKTNDCHY